MTISCERIAALVTDVQSAFIDRPTLTLTSHEAHRRFGEDARLLRAVLDMLVEARVLTVRPDGSYARFFRRHTPQAA